MEYIDLKVYFSKLLKNWIIVLLCCVIGASGAFIYSKFMATPMYSSSVKMSLYDSSQGGVSISTVQVTYELIENCLVVLEDEVTYEKVAEIVNEEMGTNYSARQIGSYISYSRVRQTFFISAKVTSPDAELSAVICNAVLAIAPEVIVDYVANTPVIALNDAKVNYNAVSPNTGKNVILGFMAGLLIVCAVIFLIVFFDRTISDEEKFKEKYDIAVLGVIPNVSVVTKRQMSLK